MAMDPITAAALQALLKDSLGKSKNILEELTLQPMTGRHPSEDISSTLEECAELLKIISAWGESKKITSEDDHVPNLYFRSGLKIFSLPMNLTIEAIRMDESEIKDVNSKEQISFQGNEIPLVRLSERLTTSKKDKTFVLVVGDNESPFGIAVDALLHSQEADQKSEALDLSNIRPGA